MTCNIHIADSHLISKWDFGKVLDGYDNEVTHHRSRFSLLMEWTCHNFLYALGIARERTGSVDLEYPQKWYITAAYIVGGMLVWMLIK